MTPYGKKLLSIVNDETKEKTEIWYVEDCWKVGGCEDYYDWSPDYNKDIRIRYTLDGEASFVRVPLEYMKQALEKISNL